jgi:hypothetical protein
VRCVGEKRQEKFVADALAAYGAVPVDIQPVDVSAARQQQQQQQAVPMTGVESSAGGDDSSRQAGGLLLRELLRESGDTFSKYASQVGKGCLFFQGGYRVCEVGTDKYPRAYMMMVMV